MNFIERLSKDLEANGLFPNQVKEVIDRIVSDETDQMRGRWMEDTTDYPDMIYNVVWSDCKRVTLNFIDETCPLAWFRPMFLSGEAQAAWADKHLNKSATAEFFVDEKSAKVTKFNYAHFPVGTIFTVNSAGVVKGKDREVIEATVTGVFQNGPNSYVLATDQPGNCTTHASFNITHVISIVKRGTGAVGLVPNQHSEYFTSHVFSKPDDVVSKHPSQYASFDAHGLVFAAASKYVTEDMCVDYDELYDYLFSIGRLPRREIDDTCYHWYICVSKKKLNRAIKRCINKFCVNHVKAQQYDDSAYEDTDYDADDESFCLPDCENEADAQLSISDERADKAMGHDDL